MLRRLSTRREVPMVRARGLEAEVASELGAELATVA